MDTGNSLEEKNHTKHLEIFNFLVINLLNEDVFFAYSVLSTSLNILSSLWKSMSFRDLVIFIICGESVKTLT